jgi:integrase
VRQDFFIWAQKKRYITDNPTTGFTPHTIASRSRVLTDAELKTVWHAAGQDDGYFGKIVKLLILTGMRRGECAALRSSWISDTAITLPADATKNGREHTVPIGAMGASLLRVAMPEQDTLLLFPARGRTETPFNGWSKSKDALDKLAPIAPWTLHDLRRTFATYLASMGVAPHIVERLINHVSGTVSGVAAIYNRYSYMGEMRTAIDAWEKRLSLIVDEHVDTVADSTIATPSQCTGGV